MSIDDLIVIPSKKVIDLITIEYDLLEQLPSGVTVTGVVVSNLVFQGFPDIAAASMIYLAPVIHGSLVQQKLRNGVPGNTYNIGFTVTLSNGEVLVKTFRLSIIPNNTPAVPISIPLYYTSQPYPIEFVDWMGSSVLMLSGGFLFNPHPLDFMSSSVLMISGDLRNVTQFYNSPPEWIGSTVEMMSGTLVDVVQNYDIPHENMSSTVAMRSGTLLVIVINYDHDKDYMSSTVQMRSGTLI